MIPELFASLAGNVFSRRRYAPPITIRGREINRAVVVKDARMVVNPSANYIEEAVDVLQSEPRAWAMP